MLYEMALPFIWCSLIKHSWLLSWCSVTLRAHSQVFLLLHQSSYSAVEIQGTILDLVCVSETCSSVCDLWFHWIQLVCWCSSASPSDANQYVQPTRPIISCYCEVLWSSAGGILLVPSQEKRSDCKQNTSGLHWQCLVAAFLLSLPDFFFSTLNLPVVDYTHLF